MNQDQLRIQLIGFKDVGDFLPLQPWPRKQDSAYVILRGTVSVFKETGSQESAERAGIPKLTGAGFHGDMSVEHPEMAVDKWFCLKMLG